jgi:hypothetical protein
VNMLTNKPTAIFRIDGKRCHAIGR